MKSIVGSIGKIVEMKAGEDVIDRIKTALDRSIVLCQLSSEVEDNMFNPERIADVSQLLLEAFCTLTTSVTEAVIDEVNDDNELRAIMGEIDPREYLLEQANKMREGYTKRIDNALLGGAHAKDEA